MLSNVFYLIYVATRRIDGKGLSDIQVKIVFDLMEKSLQLNDEELNYDILCILTYLPAEKVAT
jgi:hypothetical protein